MREGMLRNVFRSVHIMRPESMGDEDLGLLCLPFWIVGRRRDDRSIRYVLGLYSSLLTSIQIDPLVTKRSDP